MGRTKQFELRKKKGPGDLRSIFDYHPYFCLNIILTKNFFKFSITGKSKKRQQDLSLQTILSINKHAKNAKRYFHLEY